MDTQPMPLINPAHAWIARMGCKAVLIGIVFVLIPFEFLRIIGSIMIIGMLYGIINDLFACRDCIEYFTVGHIFDGQNYRYRLVNSLNPDINAIFWGISATWRFTAIAGALISICAQVPLPGTSVSITTAQMVPVFAFIALISLLISHFASRYWDLLITVKPEVLARYGVPTEFHDKWMKCGIRNTTGYLILAITTVLSAIAIIVARYDVIKCF